MSMNVYIDFADLQEALRYVDLSVSSSSTELDGEHHMEIYVAVKHRKSDLGCVGDLELGPKPSVRFSVGYRDTIVSICTKVGIPFRFH